MHLPGPLRAAVGLVATAAGEVKTLPDRAVELPMLAVSTALQVSLRAQQRYARLTARGDEVLNRQQPGDTPPAWATFDDPLSADDLHRTALAQLDELVDGFERAADADGAAEGSGELADRGPSLQEIFGITADEAAEPEASADDDTATVTPISQAPSNARKTARKSPRKSPAKKTAPAKTAAKTAAKKAPANGAPAKKAPVKKVAAKKAAKSPAAKKAAAKSPVADEQPGKPVSKPRHTAPSKFDDADD